jgi:hypothetical protein
VGYSRHLKVLILYLATDPTLDRAYVQALETQLDPIEGLSARAMSVTAESCEALLRHIGHSDIVHCLGGLPNLLASPQVSTFGASNGKAPLRIGEIVKLTEPPRPLILEGASGGAQGAGALAWERPFFGAPSPVWPGLYWPTQWRVPLPVSRQRLGRSRTCLI